jgi:hypothetical protein
MSPTDEISGIDTNAMGSGVGFEPKHAKGLVGVGSTLSVGDVTPTYGCRDPAFRGARLWFFRKP